MRYRLLIGLALAISIIAACQGPPPTQIVLVVTATSLPNDISTTVTPTSGAQAADSSTTTPALTSTPQPTPTLNLFPTSTFSEIQVAEQVFEHGRMFWVQPQLKIWVMIETGPNSGKWVIYEDTFEEGEPETDPDLIAPNGMYQPERGFGKLWRQNTDLMEQLGWGLTPEFGYVSNYEYHPGGEVRAGRYVGGPGYHILFSLSNEKFQFNETDFTWQKLQ